MLGEQISEEQGRITARRVLPPQGGRGRVEVSFESAGQLLGVDIMSLGTYWSETRPDGTMYGEGDGLVRTKDGETATWRAQGVGTMREDGSVSYRGGLYVESESSKFSRLNQIATVFEFEVDAEGNTVSKTWEWK